MGASSHRFEKIKPVFYLLPMLVTFGLFSVYPIVRTFILSFTETNVTVTKFEWVGFDQYIAMFNDRHFWVILGNTLIYSVSTVVCTIVIGLFFAAIANSKAVKYRNLFRMAAFYPYVLPMAVAAMVWIYMYNPSRGIVNLLLGTKIQWLNSYQYSLFAIIVVSIWKSLGFNFLLILAGMQNISQEFYEAAALETNSAIKRFFRITLPMLRPTLFLVVLLSVTSSFQSMDLVAIMTRGQPGNSSNVLMYYVYQQGIINGKVGYGSAISSILLLALFLFTAVYMRQERSVDYER